MTYQRWSLAPPFLLRILDGSDRRFGSMASPSQLLSHAARFQDYLSRRIERPPEMDAYVPFRSKSGRQSRRIKVICAWWPSARRGDHRQAQQEMDTLPDRFAPNTILSPTRRSRSRLSRFKGSGSRHPSRATRLFRSRSRAAHCLRECCQPPAGARE